MHWSNSRVWNKLGFAPKSHQQWFSKSLNTQLIQLISWVLAIKRCGRSPACICNSNSAGLWDTTLCRCESTSSQALEQRRYGMRNGF